MTNSRQKGARVERSTAADFKAFGFSARRGQQYCGANGDPDVMVDDLPVYVEVKARQRIGQTDLYTWLDQARAESGGGLLPLLITKKNHCDKLATVRLDDLLTLLQFADVEAWGEYLRLEAVRL